MFNKLFKSKNNDTVISTKKRPKPIWSIQVKNPIIDSIEKDAYRKDLRERKVDSIEEKRILKEARRKTHEANIKNKNEKKLLDEENKYIDEARYNIIDMMTQHCKIKCFERWIDMKELEQELYLDRSYEYHVCRKHKNYRIIANKYVYHIWYNWALITVYVDDKEERDKRAEEYAKLSFDWKQVLFHKIDRKIVFDSINQFMIK